MAAHLRHASSITQQMFDRWLELWRETAREDLEPAAADDVIARAERIAESLKLGLFFKISRNAALPQLEGEANDWGGTTLPDDSCLR